MHCLVQMRDTGERYKCKQLEQYKESGTCQGREELPKEKAEPVLGEALFLKDWSASLRYCCNWLSVDVRNTMTKAT